MDLYTADDANATEFNDYLVQTYIDISLYGINIWNVHDAIINDLPRTNNHVEGYNSRLESNFPKHPHIYHFIELLRDEHLYQHDRAEESDMQIRKRKNYTIILIFGPASYLLDLSPTVVYSRYCKGGYIYITATDVNRHRFTSVSRYDNISKLRWFFVEM
ncbi:unnamed protein product [Didymodactylos carnosus]|uniref:MULE transposase domain-containing protein n=1 Tax=Didymodactylos carnosus TaxID=1234261 RepID=A0A8S2DGQ2_9BILA|nr:unnamed protein product [Didymodactylos carnosus]CAF3674687.1 unnamed protein product [Didymodactylos carnosus]